MTTKPEVAVPSTDDILRMVQRELATPRRWVYRVSLVFAIVMLAIILSLWITEPRPLAVHLHGAFAVMSLIAIGWITVFAWILTHRDCPTAWDRIATSWMAVIASAIFLGVGVTFAMVRGNVLAAATLSATGGTFVAIAVWTLYSAIQWRRQLQRRIDASS
ncbi:MAG: hypothetical protein AAGA03_08350 [Planctomycetota bacterium]